jgi:hypothetical protein
MRGIRLVFGFASAVINVLKSFSSENSALCGCWYIIESDGKVHVLESKSYFQVVYSMERK